MCPTHKHLTPVLPPLLHLLLISLSSRSRLQYLAYRVRYLCEGHPHQLSILVRDVPLSHQDSLPFLAKFNEMYDDVIRTNVVMKLDKLSALVKKREKVRNDLEHVRVKIAKLKPGKKRPTTKAGGKCGIGGKKVDKEEYLTSQLADLNTKYNDMLGKKLSNPKWNAGGFVTFRSLASAACAQQVRPSHNCWIVVDRCCFNATLINQSIHCGKPSTWEVLPVCASSNSRKSGRRQSKRFVSDPPPPPLLTFVLSSFPPCPFLLVLCFALLSFPFRS